MMKKAFIGGIWGQTLKPVSTIYDKIFCPPSLVLCPRYIFFLGKAENFFTNENISASLYKWNLLLIGGNYATSITFLFVLEQK